MHIIFSIICFIVTQQMEHWNEKKYKDQNDSSVTQNQYLTAYHALDFFTDFQPSTPQYQLVHNLHTVLHTFPKVLTQESL